VDFPIKNGGSFQFVILNYQRVTIINHHFFFSEKCGFSSSQTVNVYQWVATKSMKKSPTEGWFNRNLRQPRPGRCEDLALHRRDLGTWRFEGGEVSSFFCEKTWGFQ
jgi:hypothetical protein